MWWKSERVEIQISATDGIVCIPSVAHEALHAAEYMVRDWVWSSVAFDDWSPKWASLDTREERIEETKCWIVERVVAAVLREVADKGWTIESADRTTTRGRPS